MSGEGLYRLVCVCMYGYLSFWWSDFHRVKCVLGVLEGAESDSDVIEAVRPMVDELWLSHVMWQASA